TFTINSYTLTVKYEYEDGTKAADTHTETVVYNSGYEVTSPAVTGHDPDRAVVTGTMPAEDHEEKVVYTANKYHYTVNYLINGTEVTVKAPTTDEATFGETVAAANFNDEVAGYQLKDNSGNIVIGVDETANVINVYYYKEVKLTANSEEGILFDGENHKVEGFTVTGTVQGVTEDFTNVTVSRTEMNADTYDVDFAASTVGTVDKNAHYVVAETEKGTLEITARPVYVQAGSKTWEFTGSVFSDDSWTVEPKDEESGLCNDDEIAEVTVTGEIKLPGKVNNVPSGAVFKAGTVASNYDVQYKNGVLEVTDRNVLFSIKVVPNGGTFKYDGTEHTVEGFEIVVSEDEPEPSLFSLFSLPEGDSFKVGANTFILSGVEAKGARTDAGEDDVFATGTPVIVDLEGDDVTKQFSVDLTEAGKLVVNKRNVTLSTGSATKEYDGTELTSKGVYVTGEGFVSGEGATYVVTGTQTEVGSSANEFTYRLSANTNASNYNITTKFGTLTVTAKEPPKDPDDPPIIIIPVDPDDPTPLHPDDKGGHVDCAMHFILAVIAMIIESVYTSKKKKYQKKIYELKKELGDTSMDK
ncbi:MAG: hypothetical protein MJ171_06115, partial [Clostridia bacterium]|nr:hypothetical protein [Clostridia bacterium]